jgi:CDP-diacylglycerol--serine O-phosphatidyltransferase
MANAKRLAFFLPNAFTGLNMACGYASIILSWRGDTFTAALILILGAIFDSVDGRVARLTGTQSSFGEQFDSLSDVVSFGVAPSILLYQHFLSDFGRMGAAASFIFLLCGALRLARFNANIDKVSSDYFQGLPIPGAAMAVIGYVFLSTELPIVKELSVVALPITLIISLLMVSSLPFCSFKDSEWVREHKRGALFLMFVLAGLTFSYYKYMIFTIMAVYILGSVFYYLKHRRRFGDVFHWKGDN